MILQCKEVVKKFGTFTAVNGVSFEIQEGECFGLLGPNGAGKSTLIRCLYGASAYDEGSIKVFGFDPAVNSRAIKEKTGVVLQDDALDDALTVGENLKIWAQYLGMNSRDRDSRTMELLRFMNLDHKVHSPIRALSGGMQRRLAFVRALLNNPRLVILDEPTTGLDPAVRRLLWDRIHGLKKQNVTILLTTHYMDEAEVLCDRLVIMDEGKVAAEGSPKNLIENYSARLERPQLGRPANLEDVFLQITGKELSANA